MVEVIGITYYRGKKMIWWTNNMLSTHITIEEENMKIGVSQRRALNRAIGKVLERTYFNEIPMVDLISAIKSIKGFNVVDEDGIPIEESGILFCGESGQASLKLSFENVIVTNSMLVLNWYNALRKTKPIEVTGYIS